MHLDAWRQLTPITNSCLSSASMASISTRSSDTMQTAHYFGDITSSFIYFLSDPSALHRPKSPRDLLTIPISTQSSEYEDPSLVLFADGHDAQQLTPSRDTDTTSPSMGGDIWRTSSLTRVSISSPSQYSISSDSVSPLRAKWSDSDLGEEVQKRRISFLDSSITSDCSITLGAASVQTGGIGSPSSLTLECDSINFGATSPLSITKESSLPRGLLSTKGRSPVFSGTVPSLHHNRGTAAILAYRSIPEVPQFTSGPFFIDQTPNQSNLPFSSPLSPPQRRLSQRLVNFPYLMRKFFRHRSQI